MYAGTYKLAFDRFLKERDEQETIGPFTSKSKKEIEKSPESQGLTGLENWTLVAFTLEDVRTSKVWGNRVPRKISQLNKSAEPCVKDQIDGVAFWLRSDSLKVATIKLQRPVGRGWVGNKK